MKVNVNSIDQEVPIGTTLSGLLSQLDIKQDRVAVELNLTVLDRKQFDRSLKEGDKIEIINFVGGGGNVPRQNTAPVGRCGRRGYLE